MACAAYAQEGYWRAANSTANAITGDVTIDKSAITIDYYRFPLALSRTLKPEELSAAFDADVNAGGVGTLYRVTVPAATKFLKKNTLCGTEDTAWMVTYITGKSLEISFFSGADPPVLTIDALANSQAACGTFTYAR